MMPVLDPRSVGMLSGIAASQGSGVLFEALQLAAHCTLLLLLSLPMLLSLLLQGSAKDTKRGGGPLAEDGREVNADDY
jgi:hypothetical protein